MSRLTTLQLGLVDFLIQVVAESSKDFSVNLNVDFLSQILGQVVFKSEISDFDAFIHILMEIGKLLSELTIVRIGLVLFLPLF